MKPALLAIVAAGLLVTAAGAQDVELTIDAKRMLAYGTLAVMTQACGKTLPPGQAAELDAGLRASSLVQTQLTEAQFTELMKTVGGRVGSNRAAVCGSLTPEFITTSLAEAARGE